MRAFKALWLWSSCYLASIPNFPPRTYCRGGNTCAAIRFEANLYHWFEVWSWFPTPSVAIRWKQALVNEKHSSSFSLQQLDNGDANQVNDPVIVLYFHYPMLDTINLLQYVLLLALGRNKNKKKSHSTVWQSAHKLPRLFVMSIGLPCPPAALLLLLRLFSSPNSVCIALPFCLDFR